jgi:hypothetical protein
MITTMFFYSRGLGRQDTHNQRRELEAVAARSGWEIVFQDAFVVPDRFLQAAQDFDAACRPWL